MKILLSAIRPQGLNASMRVLKELAIIFIVFLSCSLSAQAQRPTPSGAKPLPSATASPGLQVVTISLPDSQWGYLIRNNEGVVFISHDRSKPGWQNVPTYATEAEAIAAGNVKVEELSSTKPKSNPQPIPTKK